MKDSTEATRTGLNRTGIQMSPEQTKEMLKGMEALEADPRENARRMRAMRKHVLEHDIEHWATAFLEDLATPREPHDKKMRPPGRT